MATTYLNLSLGTPSNRKIFTCSAWVKRASTGTYPIFWFGADSNNWFMLKYESDSLRIESKNSGSTIIDVRTNALYRDFSAWYHVLVAVDTSQGTASNRIKIYVNGVQETSLQTSTYPNQNTDLNVITTAEIGNQHTTQYFDGSMAHVHFIDGTAYDADTFGETDSLTGIWKPKTAPSVTYGTNGFFLKFENSGAFGTDSSGNGNTFTVNGTMTQNIDTPSNVFATMNPLENFYNNSTFSNGNNTVAVGSSQYSYNLSTLGVSSGKWYCEMKPTSAGATTDSYAVGITSTQPVSSSQVLGYHPNDVAYRGNGNKKINNSDTSYGNSYTTNDIIGIALNLDDNEVKFYKNGTVQNSGTAISITTPASTSLGNYFFGVSYINTSNTATFQANFGNGYFGTTAVTSAQNPDDGIGIFEYDVPTGYYALNTKAINAQEYD